MSLRLKLTWMCLAFLVLTFCGSRVVSATTMPISLNTTDSTIVLSDGKNVRSFSTGNQTVAIDWVISDCTINESSDTRTIIAVLGNLTTSVEQRCTNFSAEQVSGTMNATLNSNFLSLQSYLTPNFEACTSNAVALEGCVTERERLTQVSTNTSVEFERMRAQRDVALAQNASLHEDYAQAFWVNVTLAACLAIMAYLFFLHPHVRRRMPTGGTD